MSLVSPAIKLAMGEWKEAVKTYKLCIVHTYTSRGAEYQLGSTDL